jgi:hypothetical protein
LNGATAWARSDSGHAAIRAIEVNAVQDATTAVQSRLMPQVDTALGRWLGTTRGTVNGILDSARATLVLAEDDLAARLEGRLSRAVDSLTTGAIRNAGVEGRRQTQLLVRTLSESVARDFTPVLRSSVTEATRALMAELSEGLRRDLAQAAQQAVAGAVKAGVQAGSGAVQATPLWQTIVRLVIGVIVALLLLAGAWVWREKRQGEQALDAVAEAVGASGNESLKEEIQRRALQRNVEGWLHGFLAKKGRL